MALPTAYPGFEEMQSDVAYLMGCRSFEQFCSTLRGLIDPVHYCPFCIRGTPVLVNTPGGWSLRVNDFPPQGVRAWLIVPKSHRTRISQLSAHDWVQIGFLFEKAVEDYGIKGGGLVLRFGDPHRHSGTIPHLHFNILAPDGDKEYKVSLSKDDEGRRENYARLLGYRAKLPESEDEFFSES